MISMNFNYKRFQNSYSDRKTPKYKQFKPINSSPGYMQEFERSLHAFMSSPTNQIKLNTKYINDKESIIEVSNLNLSET